MNSNHLTEDAMDRVFRALAHRTRRIMLDLLEAEPGLAVGELSDRFDISRVAVMKHLSVLEEAHLVISEKEGRSRLLYFNAVPIQRIHERWTTELSARWASHVTGIKARVEETDEAQRASTIQTPPATRESAEESP